MGQPLVPSPDVATSQSPSRSSTFYEKRRCRHGRGLLVILAVTIIIAMIICTLFAAHYYFHMYGGQGFLKARARIGSLGDKEVPSSYLPLRRVVRVVHGFDDREQKEARSILPFYPCGDQQSSCDAYNQPNICCPVGMGCYSTSLTTSGTFCCNSNATNSECQPSASRLPQCPPSSFECAEVVGGGCCLNGTSCSQNGCIEFNGSAMPPPITSIITTTVTTASKAFGPSSSDMQTRSISDQPPTTFTSTITMVIGGATTPTATSHKQGQEAQKGEGTSNPVKLWYPKYPSYAPTVMLMLVALGMALL